ncbi:hypothetical protein M8312_02385 [Sphingomonas sp. KRR8]|uniref:MotE family protein n=1 Tax=Sphingomonas sp. KRR8 TaxID=2942996 RepID=UPI002020F4CF|nr:hypothetical protein [Sphingomonas sp. KRR8]URD61382.1 hypothetical protein M8312_02385 [Sphingomonas sp. KRR8]
MKIRFSLLAMTAATAGLSALANAITGAAEPTRLGASIGDDLAARDRQAAQKARGLDLREQAARAAEARLRASGTNPTAPPSPSAQAAAAKASDEQRYAELARIYQAMKPKAAAQVLQHLALTLQVEVARRMRERSTALILAAMDPTNAAQLTTAMARQGSDKPGWMALSGEEHAAAGAGAKLPAAAPR